MLLSYRLPREPSTPRIALWRRLKALGVAQVADGLVALPADARTREQMEWLAELVLEGGGTSAVWLARPTTLGQERALATAMAAARAVEYIELAAAAQAASGQTGPGLGRAVARLRRQWREITRRDYFPPAERDQAGAALLALGEVAARILPTGPVRTGLPR